MRKRFFAILFAALIGITLTMNFVGCKKADQPAEEPAAEEPAAEEEKK